jgi:IS30 family transposase
MKKKYKHLTIHERDRIEAMKRSGYTPQEIADNLERDKTTICREMNRNGIYTYNKKGRWKQSGKYKAQKAQIKYQVRRCSSKYQCKKIEKDLDIKKYIIEKLKKKWSPDQIAGRMKLEKRNYVSSKTIYNWLYSSFGQRYCRYLPSKRYQPRKRRKVAEKTMIPNRIGIEERSDSINERNGYGHFEGDTIVSGKSTKSKTSLVVIQERKSRFCMMKRIENLKPDSFKRAANRVLNEFVNPLSLTLDNGMENRNHENIPVETYFCNPYSSWEKGGVENMNKMIRRFVPKKCNIADFSARRIKKIEDVLNNKPRKILGYKTPFEVAREFNLLKC